MQTIIYGTGSYVLGNKYVKPVILPAVLTFIKKKFIKSKFDFIKTSSNRSKINNSIKDHQRF